MVRQSQESVGGRSKTPRFSAAANDISRASRAGGLRSLSLSSLQSSLSAKSVSLSLSGRLKIEARVSGTDPEDFVFSGGEFVETTIVVGLLLCFVIGMALKMRKEFPEQSLGRMPHPLRNFWLACSLSFVSFLERAP